MSRFVVRNISSFVWTLTLTVLVGTAANAQTSGKAQPKIQKIEIQGNKKIESDAILAKLESKVGVPLNPQTVREDLRALADLGYFNDIRIEKKDSSPNQLTLVVKVKEKPSISEIIIQGNEELKTDELMEAGGLKPFELFNAARMRDATEKMQKMYEDKGFFLAKIEAKVEDVVKGEIESVRVVFNVSENEKVKVKQITFLGNKHLKDSVLKARLATVEGGFFSFFVGSGNFRQEVFDRDMQILRVLYFNEGFVQVKIDRPQIYVTPDKRSIYITIRIEEGESFDVGEVDFAGDMLFPMDELRQVIEIDKQKTFSYDTLQKDMRELQAKYGDLGYAFANVIPRTKVDEKERKVDITFEFDKGYKVYFGRINVIGNTKTRDKVVRRELKIVEDELYNETRKRRSEENVQRLGFFEEVNFKTSSEPEHPEILNLDIVVKERNTGSIQMGAGYGSATGFTFQGQVNQTNFLGKGQKLGVGLSISGDQSVYNINYTDPYYNDTKWILGADLYQSYANRYDYLDRKVGGALRVGHSLGEYSNLSLRYKYEDVKLTERTATKPNSSETYRITDLTLFPLDASSGISSSITAIFEYDTRNDRFSPSKGSYASTQVEYSGLGGTLKYTKGNVTYRYFNKLFWDVVWRNNLSYSTVAANSPGETPPINELYLLGGAYSLRGYNYARVGKTEYSNYTYGLLTDPTITSPVKTPDEARRLSYKPVGGKQQLLYQMEFEFPLIAEAGIKGVGFYDVGQAEDEISSSNFYSDVGFGFRWFSPIGPLRFEWGFPLRVNEAAPDSHVFEFSIGSPF